MSQLVLKGAALLGQMLNALLGLQSDVADRLGDQLRIGTDLVDLVDDEPLDLTGGDVRSWALVPAALLGGAADIVAIAAVALLAIRDWNEPDDDHGHMTLFQTGHVPNSPDSDDRDVSAPHVGYANFALGDGSVRGLSENIDLFIFQSLSTRSKGDVVGEY